MLLLSEEGVGVGVGYLITQPLLTHEFVHAISHTFSAKNEEPGQSGMTPHFFCEAHISLGTIKFKQHAGMAQGPDLDLYV